MSQGSDFRWQSGGYVDGTDKKIELLEKEGISFTYGIVDDSKTEVRSH